MSIVQDNLNKIPSFLSDPSGNAFRQSFFSDFLDINGNLIVRNGNINVLNGLVVSLLGNVYLSGNVISKSINSNQNVSFGAIALNNTTSYSNSAFGDYTLSSNTTGYYNTAVGANAGKTNTTGSYNTYVGSSADCIDANYNYSTAIGYGAKIRSSNQIVLGTQNEMVYFPGDVSGGVVYVGDKSRNGNANLSGNIYIFNKVTNSDNLFNSLNFMNNNTGDFIVQSTNSSSGYLSINDKFFFNKDKFGIDNNTYVSSDYNFGSNTYNLYVLGNSLVDPGVRFSSSPIMNGSNMTSFLSKDNSMLGIGKNSLQNYYLKKNTVQFIHDVYAFGVNSMSNIGDYETTDTLYDDQYIDYTTAYGLYYKMVSFGYNSSNKLSRTLINGNVIGINSGNYMHPYANTVFGYNCLSKSSIARKITLFGSNCFQNGNVGYNYGNNTLYYTHVIGFGFNSLNMTSNNITPLSTIDSSIISFGASSMRNINPSSDAKMIAINSFGANSIDQTTNVTGNIINNSFGRYGRRSIISNSNNNNSFGYYSLYKLRLGSNNNFFGSADINQSNYDFSNNNMFGYNALYNNICNDNIAFGGNALYSKPDSSKKANANIAVGFNSLYSNVTGNNNIAVGSNSLYSNTTGKENIVIGSGSLYSLSKINTGNQNIVIGSNSLINNTIGGNNIVLGGNSVINNNDSSFNYNVYIGSNTGINQSSSFLSKIGNSLCLGYGSLIDNSNQIVLGKTNANVFVPGSLNVNGNLYSPSFLRTSDYRIKKNVVTLDESFTVDNLNPLTYYNILSKSQQIGFIAHEVQKEYPYLVDGEKDDPFKLQSLNYNSIISLNINEIKNLKKKIENYKEKIKINEFLIKKMKG